MKSQKDGKKYIADTLDTQGILRLIESIPSPKAEPFKMWLAQMGKERIDEDAYLEYCGFLKEEYNSKMSKEEIKKLRYQIADNYLKTVIDYKQDAERVLKYLKQKSFTLAIASTTNDHTIEIYKKENQNIINKANIEDIFTLVYSKGAVKELKLSPEIHYKILKELDVNKEECLIIEDSLIGVEAANNAGIEVATIYDKYSDFNREEINKLSQYQFKDYNQMLRYMKDELEDN